MDFNNREIALSIVFVIFIAFALYKDKENNEILSQVWSLIRIIFSKHLFIIIVLFSIYMYYEILFLKKMTFFDYSMLKESLIWAFGAFGLIINHTMVTENKNFIKKLIFDNLKFVVLFEFICTMYTFNLFLEVILVFITTILFIMKIVMENKESNEDEKFTLKIINFLINSLGFVIILFTINELYTHYNELNILTNVKSFLLPLVLIFFYMPFYYSVILYAKYEQLFVSIGFYTRGNVKITRYLKKKIILNCFLNYSKLQTTHFNIYQVQGIDSEEEINKILNTIYK